MSESVPGQRGVAVVVRAHTASEKTLDLLRALGGNSLFDLYVLANETYGPLDFGGVAKISHTRETFKEFGWPAQEDYFSIHCSDLLLEHVRAQAPAYRHYMLVEHDVHLARGDASVVEELARVLSSPEHADVDLAAAALRHSRRPGWMWHDGAAALFPAVWGIFFPFLIVSASAITHLHRQRLAEARIRNPAATVASWVFCEAFVPSALQAAGGFRVVDLNELKPGCYRWESFNPGPPQLFHSGMTIDPAVELLHPVLDAAGFLDKALFHARNSGTVVEFLHDLRAGTWPLPPLLATEYETLASGFLQAEGDAG